jgi:hypothetical protein
MSVDYEDIKDSLDRRCPRRARHLCKIYAEEHACGDSEDFQRIYAETKRRFGLDSLV